MKRILTVSMALFIMVINTAAQERFCIAKDGKTAAIVVDEQDWKGVIRAANDLGDDVRKVAGVPATLLVNSEQRIVNSEGGCIIVGTIGKSRMIDKLVKQKKLDVSKVKGQWESFVIDVVDGNLVVAGSDKRGTIYGIYEISLRIGVSPWYWWADVPVKHQDEVYWTAGRFVSQEPTVRYRGIFINDEDWGLKPWAAKNYEKELGDIGPRTYARVCELLLRLRANMLAPAMHSCTGAFYSHPESKVVADSFGIVITTSHCEPLLLNNAAKSEWDSQRDGDWNYKTNRDVIWKKWEDRLSEAAQYENIYTVAMRGVHDEGLKGNLPMEERVSLIEKVIKDQRDLLKKYQAYTPLLRREGAGEGLPPQIFVPYKETMDIYENGLQVPDDIMLVWVDDNYGYMKRVSSPAEQQRCGRSGVYYHLSYLGAPHDYLWLNTTPPVLMYEELKKAYDTGADRYWLLNVGDIKPMELGMQTFFDMAWNINSFSFEKVRTHQAEFLTRLFGLDGNHKYQISKFKVQSLLDDYYRLAWSRKPEFMGWEYEWDDKAHTGLKPTEFSFANYSEAQRRLADYQRISDEAGKMSLEFRDERLEWGAAWFELVQFPVQGACQMNRKFLTAQLNQELLAQGRTAEANWTARQSQMAYDSINALIRRYNEQLNGKWRGMMDLAPGWCALYQKMPEVTYTEGAGETPVDLTPQQEDVAGCYVISLDQYIDKSSDAQLVRGIGYDGQVLQLGSPTSSGSQQPSSVTYSFPQVTADSIDLVVYTVPFWPIYKGKGNAISITVDGGSPQVFDNRFKEYDRTWKDQVMRNGATCRLHFAIDKKKPQHTIRFQAVDPGQMLQRVVIDWGGLKTAYIGPSLTFVPMCLNSIVFGTPLDAAAVMKQAREIAKTAEVKTLQKWDDERDKKCAYYFEDAKEEMPFRVCVPKSWDGKKKLPLVMFLHGGWNDESSYLDQHDKLLVRLADKYGYILVSPLGAHSSYGNRMVLPAEFGKDKEVAEILEKRSTPEMMREQELSEQDVINVLEIVLKNYPVDRSRMFLCGHSMGSGGTWYLGAKYADYWRSLAPMSGPFVTREGYPWERMKQMPILISEGTRAGASLQSSRDLRDFAKEYGLNYQYKEVDGDHGEMWPIILPAIFEFFNQQQ